MGGDVRRPLDPSTIAVALGRGTAGAGAAVNVPVELSSTYHQGGEAIYGRDGNATWRAFEGVMLSGEKPAEVAARLGTSVNAVLLAKSHVLRRLRQEARDLLD